MVSGIGRFHYGVHHSPNPRDDVSANMATSATGHKKGNRYDCQETLHPDCRNEMRAFQEMRTVGREKKTEGIFAGGSKTMAIGNVTAITRVSQGRI